MSIMREQIKASKKSKVEAERKQLEEKVSEAEKQLKEVQDKLKRLNESDPGFGLLQTMFVIHRRLQEVARQSDAVGGIAQTRIGTTQFHEFRQWQQDARVE